MSKAKTSMFEQDTNNVDETPATEEQVVSTDQAPEPADMLSLAKDEAKFKKKIADIHDKLIEAEDTLDDSWTTIRETKSVEEATAALKNIKKADAAVVRLREARSSFEDMLAGVRQAMKDQL